MNNPLRGSHYLIAGGGSGIGYAIAARLIEENAAVTLLSRTEEKLRTAAESIGSPRVFVLPGDIAKPETIPSLLDCAADLMGGLDGVINCAAMGSNQTTGRGWETWDITPEEWDTICDINLRGAFFLMRDAVNYMLNHQIRGNILNIASNAACMGIEGPYGASKLSLLKLTRKLGQRYGEHGIILNGIAPGATATPMIQHYCQDPSAPYPRHAIGRYIQPEEIAEIARFLLGTCGEVICGHTIIADGGDRMATL